jgi:hypothetical protein
MADNKLWIQYYTENWRLSNTTTKTPEFIPPFFLIKLKKNTFVYFIMETYIVQLAKGIRIFG